MITSKELERMSDEEFDSFQKEEIIELRKQMGEFSVPESPTFQCGNCKKIFESNTYVIITCSHCGFSFNFKQEFINRIKLIEESSNFVKN